MLIFYDSTNLSYKFSKIEINMMILLKKISYINKIKHLPLIFFNNSQVLKSEKDYLFEIENARI